MNLRPTILPAVPPREGPVARRIPRVYIIFCSGLCVAREGSLSLRRGFVGLGLMRARCVRARIRTYGVQVFCVIYRPPRGRGGSALRKIKRPAIRFAMIAEINVALHQKRIFTWLS